MFFGTAKIQKFSQIIKYLAHRNHRNHRNFNFAYSVRSLCRRHFL